MFYVIMKFKNYILCHKLYIILITNFQYLMNLYINLMFYNHEIYFMSFYIRNSLTFMSLQI